jgi:hypothetical protein
MNRLIALVVIGLVTLSSTTIAGENEEQATKHSLHKGAFALNFGLSGSLLDISLRDYMDSYFSGKYQLSDKRALRFGINFSGSSEDRDYDRTRVYNSTSSYHDQTEDRSSSGNQVSLFLQYIWYIKNNKNYYFTMGIGPTMDLRRTEYDSDNTNYQYDPDGNSENRSLNNGLYENYFVGLTGSIGVEIFVVSNLSLLAEFHPSIGYTFSERSDNQLNSQQNYRDSSYREKTKKLSYKSNHVRLGISVYF